jgi:cardiolipin synthase
VVAGPSSGAERQRAARREHGTGSLGDGGIVQAEPDVSGRIATLPNALSLLRLFGVPLFCWLILGPHADGWAVVVLAVSGFTDWLDGKIARAWNQTSRLGQLLDPTVDRLYTLSAILCLGARDIVPWWLVGLLLARDLGMAIALFVLRRNGYGPPPVHFLGKAATFNLLFAFPLLLLGAGSGVGHEIARVLGWAFTCWGTALYWWAGVLYVLQIRSIIRDGRRGDGEREAGPGGRSRAGQARGVAT